MAVSTREMVAAVEGLCDRLGEAERLLEDVLAVLPAGVVASTGEDMAGAIRSFLGVEGE
jgi:hypothetical protein